MNAWRSSGNYVPDKNRWVHALAHIHILNCHFGQLCRAYCKRAQPEANSGDADAKVTRIAFHTLPIVGLTSQIIIVYGLTKLSC